MLIGLISDTHGIVRPAYLAALAGVDLILHAGDVGGDTVLKALRRVAPVRAVAGNTDPADHPELASALEETWEEVRIHVSHGHELGQPTPAALLARYRDADVIVFGHTHRPVVERAGPRLVINPGAAGPRRFHLRPSVARLRLAAGRAEVEIVPI
jgi:putative phosphoesterase